MTVKIVTDSTADLPPRLAKELGVTVVPVYLRFSDSVYCDRVDISEDEFYQRLLCDPIHPNTTQPTPQDFADVYQKLSQEADGIISIHVSSKLSGTCNSALQGKELVKRGCPIEVVDSRVLSMSLGLLAIAATTIARSENSLQEMVTDTKEIVSSIRSFILLDTLKYLALGRRIGKAQALLGSVLNVKPILTVKDGELIPVGRVRNRGKGIDKLFDFVKSAVDIQDLAIVHVTTPDEVQMLCEHIGSVFPKERIRLARVGPALGVHGGPGAIMVTFREKDQLSIRE